MEERLPQITNLKLFKTKNLEVSIFDIKIPYQIDQNGEIFHTGCEFWHGYQMPWTFPG